MSFQELVAQISSDNGKALLTYGPLGVFCAWLMFRAERMGSQVLTEIRELSHRIDGITRAMLADVISRDTSGEKAKDIAKDMLRKIEENDARRR